jgi:hypothetical protein
VLEVRLLEAPLSTCAPPFREPVADLIQSTAAANTIMVCGQDGIAKPVTTCSNGQTCQNVGVDNGPTCA